MRYLNINRQSNIPFLNMARLSYSCERLFFFLIIYGEHLDILTKNYMFNVYQLKRWRM